MRYDLLIRNAQVFNSGLKQFFKQDVAVKDGKFLYIADHVASNMADAVVEGEGQWLVPGLIDCHMHIESSMTTAAAFSDAVIPHGVTTVIAEPHEIANVFGMDGIQALLQDGEACVLDIRLAIPSSVPSTNEALETTGGVIGLEEIRELLQDPRTICLGEIMNCKELIETPKSKTAQLVALCRQLRPDLPIEGHCPAFMDWELSQIIYAGVTADHTEQTPERMAARIKNGMFVQLQRKTLRPENIAYVQENDLWEHIAIVTDDTMPHALATEGHLDVLVRKAIELGVSPENAIYVTTLTPARRMRLFDRGMIALGRLADFLLLDDLHSFSIAATYRQGVKVYERKSNYLKKSEGKAFPQAFYHSVNVPPLTEADFTIQMDVEEGLALCKVMVVQDGTTFIQESTAEIPVVHGELQWEDSPYALAMVFERHGKTKGSKGYALVGGNALQKGAAATTYAHDHHNLLVLGQNKVDMVVAANQVIAAQGGYAVAYHQAIQAFAPLPIAGILYDGPVETLGAQMQAVVTALTKLGYRHSNIIMSLSTLGLPVSPYLKVTNRGLVDVKKQEIVDPIIRIKAVE